MRFTYYRGIRVAIICKSTKNTRIQYPKGPQELVPTHILFPQAQAADPTANLIKHSVAFPEGQPTLDKVRNLATTLMARHGLLQKGWRFVFDEAQRRAGICRYSSRVIGLSRYFATMNTWDEINDTILHEIAHALAGSGHGHDRVWKAVCVKIGARPVRCYDSKKVNMPKARYEAKCSCGNVWHRHSPPPGDRSYYCTNCFNRAKPVYLKWVDTRFSGPRLPVIPVGNKEVITLQEV